MKQNHPDDVLSSEQTGFETDKESHESANESSANDNFSDENATEVIIETADDTSVNGEVEDLRQQLMRIHADFDNFRKRTRIEKEDLQRFATKSLLTDLLPVADNFERAMTSLADASENIRSGVEMVHRQLLQVFQKNGVEVQNPVGQTFDPNLHEAVMQEPATDGIEPGTVVQVFQPGYVMNGKMLRPAMVKVTV